MRTEMDDAKIYHVRLVSARKVVLTFDMDEPENANLRDVELVKRSMASYLLAYPNVEKYDAVYVDNWLVLTVVGTIRTSIVDMYL